MKGEFQGINDFEVVAFLVVLPDKAVLPENSPIPEAAGA